MNEIKRKIVGRLFLILAAMLFGMSYVANKYGGGVLPAASYVGLRCMLGALVVLPLVMISGKKREESQADNRNHGELHALLLGGILGGISLFLGLFLTVIGLQYTDVSKAGFITVLYIFAVPMINFLMGKKIPKKTWLCVGIALTGFYFLSMQESMTVAKGDLIMVASMLFFAIHMVIMGTFAPNVNGIELSFVQYVVCSIIGIFAIAFTGGVDMSQLKQALPAILYAGICGTGLGFTCQTLGQARVEASASSLILSTESLFALLAGMVFFKEMLSAKELIGGALVMTGVVISQLDFSTFKNNDCK